MAGMMAGMVVGMIDRPLRFCMITTFYPPYSFGGDAVFVQRLSGELARRGHHVEVIHCIDSYRLLAGGEPHGTYEEEPNLVVHGLRSRFGPFSPLATQQTGRPIFTAASIQSVLDKGFDVIHYHNVSLVGGPLVLSMGSGIKLYTTHEFWLVCPMHVLFRDGQRVCTEAHCLPCTLRHGRPPQWWRYTRMLPAALRHVDRFLAPSRFAIAMHRARGLDLPFSHLPYFVPPPTPAKATSSPLPSAQAAQPYFLFVGRLERIKGVQTLIPFFRAQNQMRLLIAGTGGYESELRRQAAGAPNIHFLGHLPMPELSALYSHALALLVPSLCYEIFGLVVPEAFAHGTPVIARRIGGLADIVPESGAGFVFDDDPSLQRSVEVLQSNSVLRAELGARARRAYWANWSPDVHVQRYLSIIGDLLAPGDQSVGHGAP
jgi:glycosyltransferase involved in cell wall biosynthesis